MELFILEKINMERGDTMQQRVRQLERQLDQLRGICTGLYRIHSYFMEDIGNNNREEWNKARSCMSKIEKNSWNEEKDTLTLYKAQACCYLGTVYKEQGDYDEALKYLTKARERIEALSAESVISECYARTCIGQAKCHMEKHSPAEVIRDCHACAGEAIEDMKTDKERAWILRLELSLQEAIFLLDTYTAGEEEKEQQILNKLADADALWKPYKERKMSCSLEDRQEDKIEVTLLTTKADYFKKMYFKMSDCSHYQENDPLTNEKSMKYYFEKSFRLFARIVKKHPDNTMGLNSMAILLYDHYKKEKNEEYLSTLLKECLSLTYSESEPSPVICAIHKLLNDTLDTECNNMFALNMKAVLSDNSRDTGTINYFRVLGQSALKHRFRNLKELVGDVYPEKLRAVMTNLIILHSKASEFMDSAIIDFADPQWRGLKVGHYTRLEVLPKLINKNPNSRMRIQNVHHLNDPLEGVLFVDILEKIFEGKICRPDSIIAEVLALYGFQQSGTVRNSVYMGSFTGRMDQLNMWTRYGDGGKGCSLQFDAANSFDKRARNSMEELFTAESDYSYKMEDTKYPLYMVLYLPRRDTEKLGEIEKYARNRAATSKLEKVWWEKQADMTAKLMELMGHITYIIKKINSDFDEIGKRLNESSRKRARSELCNIIIMILDLVRFLIKSDYYRDEREYRIIQYSSDPEYYCTEDGIPKLYINVEKKLMYEKVCFGPLVQNFDSHAAYVLNIKKDKYEDEPKKTWGLEVCRSEIDYR
ncbi:MAG: DUF2971 domain-containing protein [Acetatifactor sp.]|nr:DUF2971 domain-containing protein [Acetatifactor sp.]